MTEAIAIYTDGSCTGNPGPGGFAAIIQIPGQSEITVTGGEPRSTNNRMELSAVIEALALVTAQPQLENLRIAVHTDSQYVCRAFQENWFRNWNRNGWRNSRGNPVLNPELWQRLLKLTQGRRVSWNWVKGHAGHPQNERCDRMAGACAAQAATRPEYWHQSASQEAPPTAMEPVAEKTAERAAPQHHHNPPQGENTRTEQHRCEVCLQPARPENSFPLHPMALLHAVAKETSDQLNARWDREGVPEDILAHTTCITSPELLDWPRNTPYQAWATTRIAELECRLSRLEAPQGRRP